ncbi:MAG: metallophosphatase [Rhizobiaceae bacterium]|nr:metallophosphatase [Rhizobiaceae bacterium]
MSLDLESCTDDERPTAIVIAGEPALCDRRGALYFPGHGLLCVSDMHLEKGSSLARRGYLVPPYDSAATLIRLEAAVAKWRPRIVVSLGDSFHDCDGAGRMPDNLRAGLAALATGRDWFWVAGNHDPQPPAGLPGETVNAISLGALTFRHHPGPGASDGEIAGHLHPGAMIVQRGRAVRRRCFAADGRRLIMPAFGAYTGSLNVLDRAYAGLFRRDGFMAYMIGAQRIFAISGGLLRPG